MLKVLSLFSGIGAFEKALKRQEVPFELVNYCEIDKYASKSYAAIHGVSEDLNLWDITKVDEKKLPKKLDLITYGFPCQDISLAGKQRGFYDKDGRQRYINKSVAETYGIDNYEMHKAHKISLFEDPQLSDEYIEKARNGEDFDVSMPYDLSLVEKNQYHLLAHFELP